MVSRRSPVLKCCLSKDTCSAPFSQAVPSFKTVCWCQMHKASSPLSKIPLVQGKQLLSPSTHSCKAIISNTAKTPDYKRGYNSKHRLQLPPLAQRLCKILPQDLRKGSFEQSRPLHSSHSSRRTLAFAGTVRNIIPGTPRQCSKSLEQRNQLKNLMHPIQSQRTLCVKSH